MSPSEVARHAAPAVLIRPHSGWVPVDLAELWRYRELVGFMALRDIRVRYKQSLLGVSWAVLQPLATMVVFGLLFGVLLGRGRMPTLEGVPYAVSTFCALVPWQLFATSVSRSGNSLVANQNLITKVYFPRLVAPLTPILAALVDFALALAVLLGMALAYGIRPGPEIAFLPLFALLAVASALAVSLWLAALNAIYRDVQHAIPFVVQLWMFLTPVVYTTASVMEGRSAWLQLLFGLNPMAGVVEGFRWALLGGAQVPWIPLVVSLPVVTALLVGGLFFFRRMERTFADLV